MTPDEKDLERAEEITTRLVYVPDSFGAQKENSMPQGNWNQENIEIIAYALREERQRLLNDPRIKVLNEMAKNVLHQAWACGLDHGSLTFEFVELEKSLTGFESLLKENEQGKP